MTKRGKILRDAQAGPGLLMVEGQQYPFTLDGVWKSDTPPRPGSTVEVEFDPAGKIVGLTAIPDAQLAKEQADKAMAAAREKGGALLSTVVAKVGGPALVALLVLLVAWFFLSAVSVQAGGQKMGFTFWQVLGLLNASSPAEAMDPNGHLSAGFYGLLALLCLVGPFVHHFWKDKRAFLLGVLPLLFMVIVAMVARNTIHNAFAVPAGMDFGGLTQEMQKEAQSEMMSAISLSIGSYLAILASLYFAAVGIRRYLAGKAAGPQDFPKPQKAIA
jgi:hypothetical protein